MTNRNLVMLICLTGVLSAACHSAKVEPRNVSAPAQSAASEPAYKAGPQPTEAELRDAIKRIYEDNVTIDNSQPTFFVTGDFNGDSSEDVAIVVKPAKGKLAELNSEYVNWILEDPQVSVGEKKPRTARVPIGHNDLLLAVIHGYTREGWRNALATQTYLLKNAVAKEFAAQAFHKGDVIREKLRGSDGIIYWTGAKYAWRPVS